MNVTAKPFDNHDVRNAIKYSLNREEILDKVFFGYGTVGNDNPIAPTVKFAVDPQPKHVYDPEMAKSLLKKAGLESLSLRPVGRRCRLRGRGRLRPCCGRNRPRPAASTST